MKPTLQFVVGIMMCLLLLVSVQVCGHSTVMSRQPLVTRKTFGQMELFYSGISPRLQHLLLEAMTEWQNETCPQFQPQDQETDYIKFYSYPNEEYCTRDSVGRMGGEQKIKLGYCNISPW